VSRPGYVYHLREPVGYEDGWSMQRNLADAVSRGAMPDTVLLLEHAPVITLGRRTEPGELHVPDGAEVEIVETDRGGKSTYHGPGQLVCYPIFDLKRHGQDVKRYCRDLEEALIRTLLPLDIAAIEKSVEETGRCMVAMEAPRTSGFASELVAQVQERCFYHLEAPIERVTGWDTPYPHAYEWAYFPGPKRMKRALEKVMAD